MWKGWLIRERQSQIRNTAPVLSSPEKEVIDHLENCPGLVSSTSFLTSSRYLLDTYYAPVLCLVLHRCFLNCNIMGISPRNLMGRDHLSPGSLSTSPKKEPEFEDPPVTLLTIKQCKWKARQEYISPKGGDSMDIEHYLLMSMGRFFPEPGLSWGLVEVLPSSLTSTMSTLCLCSSCSGECNRSLLPFLDCLSLWHPIQSDSKHRIIECGLCCSHGPFPSICKYGDRIKERI